MNKDLSKEVHPDWYKDIPTMHCLILGSFPPHPSKRQYPFFYPNGRNRFWRVLADLAKVQLQWTKLDKIKAVEERFEIMKILKTELTYSTTVHIDESQSVSPFIYLKEVAYFACVSAFIQAICKLPEEYKYSIGSLE